MDTDSVEGARLNAYCGNAHVVNPSRSLLLSSSVIIAISFFIGCRFLNTCTLSSICSSNKSSTRVDQITSIECCVLLVESFICSSCDRLSDVLEQLQAVALSYRHG